MASPIPDVSVSLLEPGNSADPASGTILGFTPASWIRVYQHTGPVFRLAETGLVCLCGPEANAAAWRTPDDWSYAASRTGSVFISQLGTDYITASDGDIHRRQRKLLRPAVTRDTLARHMPVIADALLRGYGAMADGGVPVDLHAELIVVFTRAFNRTTVVSGADDTMIDAIARFEEEMIRGGALEASARVAWYARPAYRALRERVLGHFRTLVRARLAKHAAGLDAVVDDSLDLIIRAMPSAEAAEGAFDELVRDAYLLQAGGAGNIASMVCNLLSALIRRPDLLHSLEEELAGVGIETLAAQGLRDMPLMTALLQETERRFAPTPLMPKVAARDLDFLGVAIPCGLEVLHLFGVANFLPEHYPEPMRFEPARWMTGKIRKPVAFGGGEHMCLGIDIARVCLLLGVVTVLRSFSVREVALPVYRRCDPEDAESPMRVAWDVHISR